METQSKKRDVDTYIAAAAPNAQPILKHLRALIQSNVPHAKEVISYQMPAYKLTRTFIYFAAFKTHIGIYPPVTRDQSLIEALKPYRNAKGNLKFPLNQPIPYELISRVALALAQEYS